MNKSALSLLAAIPLMFGACAAGAEDMNVGIGADVGNAGTGGMIYLPVRIGHLRIEPEFSSTKSKTITSTATMTVIQTSSTRKLGVGVYYAFEPTGQTQLYLGARIGRLKKSSSLTYVLSSDTSGTSGGTYILPTLGAEYFFDPHFSMGITVSYVLRSKDDGMTYFNGYPSSNFTNDYSGSTESHAMLRYYF